MPARRQTQVIARFDGLAGRALATVREPYRKKVLGPMVRRIRKARSLDGLLKQLDARLVKEMDESVIAKGLELATSPAIGIGMVSADGGMETSKRRRVETSKR